MTYARVLTNWAAVWLAFSVGLPWETKDGAPRGITTPDTVPILVMTILVIVMLLMLETWRLLRDPKESMTQLYVSVSILCLSTMFSFLGCLMGDAEYPGPLLIGFKSHITGAVMIILATVTAIRHTQIRRDMSRLEEVALFDAANEPKPDDDDRVARESAVKIILTDAHKRE